MRGGIGSATITPPLPTTNGADVGAMDQHSLHQRRLAARGSVALGRHTYLQTTWQRMDS